MHKACLGTNKQLEKLLDFHRQRDFTSPESRQCALEAYNSQIGDGHCVYWNDKFYIAVMCGLDENMQRESALRAVVSNGWKGYFAVKTPAGFDNREVLQKLKVSSYYIFNLSYGLGFPESQELDFSMIDRVAGIFGLREEKDYSVAKKINDGRVLFAQICREVEERRVKKKAEEKK